MKPGIQNTLQKLLVMLLIAVSLASTFQQWQHTRNIDKGSEALERWEERLAPARDAIPVERGVIGFVSDWNVPGIEYHFSDVESEFLLTQYALAPLVLVNGPVAEWNIAILNNRAFKIWEEANAGQFEVIRFKNGIYLLHRLETP